MRLVSTVLFVVLTGSAALADDAKPADPKPEAADPKPEVTKKKVPYRVVKILPETGQVLLFDKHKGAHVVAEVGQSLDGYTVDDIDDDEVTLVSESGMSVILTAPPPPPRKHQRAAKKAPAPVDPYADSSEADATSGAGKPVADGTVPVDPYAEPSSPEAGALGSMTRGPEAPQAPGEGGVRVASAGEPKAATSAPAPIVDAGPTELSDPYGDPGIAAFAEAVGAAPAGEARATDSKAKGKTKTKPAPSPDAAASLASAATGTESPAASAPTAAPGSTVIARSELDAALADFSKLAGSFRASFTADGLRFDSIHDGSLLAKLGLRKGDVVTSVDGRPLRTLDDAANLYARSSAVKSTTVLVTRAGKPVTLRVVIQ